MQVARPKRTTHHRCLAGLARLAIFTVVLLPQTGRATSCSGVSPKQFLEGPALIFAGTIQRRDTHGNHMVTRYKIDALYKGVVDGDTVDVAAYCILVDGCPKDQSYSPGSHVVRVAVSDPSTASLAPFTEHACMNLHSDEDLLELLPLLDRYRVSLVNAHRRAEAKPRSIERWDAVAELQLQNRDYLGALDTLRRLRQLAPNRQQYVVQTGDSLRGLNRYSEALEQYELALKLGPAGDDVRAGRFRVFAATEHFSDIDADWRDFSEMDLANVSFAGRKLQAARFMRSTLYECDLTGIDLTGADFSDSRCTSCIFTGAVLRNAKLRRANLDALSLPKGALADADLTGVSLYAAQLPGADLGRVNLTDANLEQANLSGANLKGAIFVRTQLLKANLSDTDLRGADLTSANLLGADMRDARYDCTTKFPRGFAPTELTEVASPECP